MLKKMLKIIVGVGRLSGMDDASETEKFNYAFDVAREVAPKGSILQARRLNKFQIEVTTTKRGKK